MNREEVLLAYANLNDLVNKASSDLDEFLLQNKVTRGREFRRRLREIRDICKDVKDKSLQYEKILRDDKDKK